MKRLLMMGAALLMLSAPLAHANWWLQGGSQCVPLNRVDGTLRYELSGWGPYRTPEDAYTGLEALAQAGYFSVRVIATGPRYSRIGGRPDFPGQS